MYLHERCIIKDKTKSTTICNVINQTRNICANRNLKFVLGFISESLSSGGCCECRTRQRQVSQIHLSPSQCVSARNAMWVSGSKVETEATYSPSAQDLRFIASPRQMRRSNSSELFYSGLIMSYFLEKNQLRFPNRDVGLKTFWTEKGFTKFILMIFLSLKFAYSTFLIGWSLLMVACSHFRNVWCI